MRHTLALSLALMGAPAISGEYPALFDVTGVNGDDVLNIRDVPSASGTVIGSFAHDATGIEVMGENDGGTWALVNVNEGSGWTSLRFLQSQDSGEDDPPRVTACFGTEPFWTLDLSGEVPVFSTPDDGERVLTISSETWAAGRRDRHLLSFLADDGDAHLIVARQSCSDGMSDRAYGLSGDVIFPRTQDTRLYAGCCTISPR